MRSVACVLASVVLVSAFGCQAVPAGGPTTQPGGIGGVLSGLAQNPLVVKATVSLATNVALLNVKQDERAAVAKYVYEAGYALKAAVQSGTVDTAQLDSLTAGLFKNVNSPQALAAGAVLRTVESLVLSTAYGYLTGPEDASGAGAKSVAQSLLAASADGIMDASVAYTAAVPSPKPPRLTARAAPGKVVIVPLDWQPAQ